ncbi:hypothetical protein O181_011924 [Austropuccinia psidii MF-1]|uniref:Integrase zinc-binding domain-containing protein n=1 Tax=Austropuccinia psidii MF-1 TaxID=1389203 RepID=A0A9Q3GMC4_9BASI|nr:hypothetical protein [Austropuccinia psidii MF-1]
MKIERRKNFRLFEWEPGSDTPDNNKSGPEEIETLILGIRSSEIHNEFFNSVIKNYAKHKWFRIFLQLLQQKYRSPEVESQLEEPWLKYYKDNRFFLIYELLYYEEIDTSSLTVIDRDHISLILQEFHDCPYKVHISKYRTKERVASSSWWPQWEQELSKYSSTC